MWANRTPRGPWPTGKTRYWWEARETRYPRSNRQKRKARKPWNSGQARCQRCGSQILSSKKRVLSSVIATTSDKPFGYLSNSSYQIYCLGWFAVILWCFLGESGSKGEVGIPGKPGLDGLPGEKADKGQKGEAGLNVSQKGWHALTLLTLCHVVVRLIQSLIPKNVIIR